MKYISYLIDKSNKINFNNNIDFCIGTGRMGLALHKEYQEQLKLVQDKIGFKYIRGHGLFCDDMAIYNEYVNEDGKNIVEYNFTYLDRIFDYYEDLNISPFLELGFMPEKIASGNKTVFYWKGNVTPPKDYDLWCNMVKALFQHLLDRYGSKVLNWPIEVWNEPNLDAFWENANKKEYFKLFSKTFSAIKSVNNNFKVGGPAICGVDDEIWLTDFLKFCQSKSIKLDFITRHFYTFDNVKLKGHYSYGDLRDIDESLKELIKSREIIDSFTEYRNIPMHITEFNTSYRPDSLIHDTITNATYLAQILANIGDVCQSYSYWTFGDVFEELGVPLTQFHGGFGLVANNCIPKPTFWLFSFFKKLKGKCIHRSKDSIICCDNENFSGIVWNTNNEKQSITFNIPNCEDVWSLTTYTIDENHCNPLKIWEGLGNPKNPSRKQISILQDCSIPHIKTKIINSKNIVSLDFKLTKDTLIYFELYKL